MLGGSDINSVILSGTLDSSPTTIPTKSGSQGVSLTLAVSRMISDREEGSRNLTSWFNVASYSTAVVEMLTKLKQGDKVLLQGSLSVRSWADKETGQKRLSYEVLVDRASQLSAEAGEAADVNVVSMSGTVDAAPRVVTTKNDTQAVSLSLACSRTIVDKVEGVKDLKSWFGAASYDESAVSALSKLSKDDRVLVQGSLTVRSWVDQSSGQKRIRYEVAVDKSTTLGSASNGSSDDDSVINTDLPDDIFG